MTLLILGPGTTRNDESTVHRVSSRQTCRLADSRLGRFVFIGDEKNCDRWNDLGALIFTELVIWIIGKNDRGGGVIWIIGKNDRSGGVMCLLSEV